MAPAGGAAAQRAAACELPALGPAGEVNPQQHRPTHPRKSSRRASQQAGGEVMARTTMRTQRRNLLRAFMSIWHDTIVAESEAWSRLRHAAALSAVQASFEDHRRASLSAYAPQHVTAAKRLQAWARELRAGAHGRRALRHALYTTSHSVARAKLKAATTTAESAKAELTAAHQEHTIESRRDMFRELVAAEAQLRQRHTGDEGNERSLIVGECRLTLARSTMAQRSVYLVRSETRARHIIASEQAVVWEVFAAQLRLRQLALLPAAAVHASVIQRWFRRVKAARGQRDLLDDEHNYGHPEYAAGAHARASPPGDGGHAYGYGAAAGGGGGGDPSLLPSLPRSGSAVPAPPVTTGRLPPRSVESSSPARHQQFGRQQQHPHSAAAARPTRQVWSARHARSGASPHRGGALSARTHRPLVRPSTGAVGKRSPGRFEVTGPTPPPPPSQAVLLVASRVSRRMPKDCYARAASQLSRDALKLQTCLGGALGRLDPKPPKSASRRESKVKARAASSFMAKPVEMETSLTVDPFQMWADAAAEKTPSDHALDDVEEFSESCDTSPQQLLGRGVGGASGFSPQGLYGLPDAPLPRAAVLKKGGAAQTPTPPLPPHAGGGQARAHYAVHPPPPLPPPWEANGGGGGGGGTPAAGSGGTLTPLGAIPPPVTRGGFAGDGGWGVARPTSAAGTLPGAHLAALRALNNQEDERRDTVRHADGHLRRLYALQHRCGRDRIHVVRAETLAYDASLLWLDTSVIEEVAYAGILKQFVTAAAATTVVEEAEARAALVAAWEAPYDGYATAFREGAWDTEYALGVEEIAHDERQGRADILWLENAAYEMDVLSTLRGMARDLIATERELRGRVHTAWRGEVDDLLARKRELAEAARASVAEHEAREARGYRARRQKVFADALSTLQDTKRGVLVRQEHEDYEALYHEYTVGLLQFSNALIDCLFTSEAQARAEMEGEQLEIAVALGAELAMFSSRVAVLLADAIQQAVYDLEADEANARGRIVFDEDHSVWFLADLHESPGYLDRGKIADGVARDESGGRLAIRRQETLAFATIIHEVELCVEEL